MYYFEISKSIIIIIYFERTIFAAVTARCDSQFWIRTNTSGGSIRITNNWNSKLLRKRSMLDESLQLGCDYIAANQKEDTGNFNYQYYFVKRKMDQDDSPVRQAGFLWGMTLCFQSQPNNGLYRASVEKGFAFFQDHVIDGPVPGSRMIEYPSFDESQSGVNALYGLALIDYLRTIRDNPFLEADDSIEAARISIRDLEDQLAMTIRFLKYMQNSDLHFSEAYNFKDEEKSRLSSPYYDGETLLCLVKAAKYMEDEYGDSLIPIIEEAAPVLAKSYTLDVWRGDTHDSDQTKGFYQWSGMGGLRILWRPCVDLGALDRAHAQDPGPEPEHRIRL